MPTMAVANRQSGTSSQRPLRATETLTLRNEGPGATTETDAVSDNLPAGLTATVITGRRQSSSLSEWTSNVSDAVAQGSSYPVITLTVNVASTAVSSVTNTATVS